MDPETFNSEILSMLEGKDMENISGNVHFIVNMIISHKEILDRRNAEITYANVLDDSAETY